MASPRPVGVVSFLRATHPGGVRVREMQCPTHHWTLSLSLSLFLPPSPEHSSCNGSSKFFCHCSFLRVVLTKVCKSGEWCAPR